MPDRYDIIEVTDHDRIVAVMNETVKGNYPPNYEQYALAYDPTLDLITQIKSWQSAEKLDAINIMLTEAAEAFGLANGIVIYSVRVDILQRLIRAFLTTAYAHLPDKRNSADIDDGKAIFHAFSFGFGSVAGLAFPLPDSPDWLFHQDCKKWKNWILNVYVKAATITAVFRLVADMPIIVHANPEIAMINPSMIGHGYRLTYAEHVNAVAIALTPHLWRPTARRSDLDRLSARMMALTEGLSTYDTRSGDNRWIFRFPQFTGTMGARRYAELIKHLHLVDPAYEPALP